MFFFLFYFVCVPSLVFSTPGDKYLYISHCMKANPQFPPDKVKSFIHTWNVQKEIVREGYLSFYYLSCGHYYLLAEGWNWLSLSKVKDYFLKAIKMDIFFTNKMSFCNFSSTARKKCIRIIKKNESLAPCAGGVWQELPWFRLW